MKQTCAPCLAVSLLLTAALALLAPCDVAGLSKSKLLPRVERDEKNEPAYLPIVLWHGMGDSCCYSHSIGAVKQRIEEALPGTFVYSIATGRGEELDVLSSYFGDVNEQVEKVCEELLMMKELENGYVGVGFSQGGQFLRAVVQRCQHLGPKMHTLVTMGSQHQGVMDVPGCWVSGAGYNVTPPIYCKIMQGLVSRGAYNSWVQSHIVQAQYFKDPWHLDQYLQRSHFLADINNEVAGRRVPRYRANLASLRRLVLFQFDDDMMVVPKESSHFGFYNGSQLVGLRDTDLYRQDWIGLRQLDQAGRLELAHCPGAHMHFSLDWFEENVVRPYLAVPVGQAAAEAAAEAAAGSLQ